MFSQFYIYIPDVYGILVYIFAKQSALQLAEDIFQRKGRTRNVNTYGHPCQYLPENVGTSSPVVISSNYQNHHGAFKKKSADIQ